MAHTLTKEAFAASLVGLKKCPDETLEKFVSGGPKFAKLSDAQVMRLFSMVFARNLVTAENARAAVGFLAFHAEKILAERRAAQK